MGPDCILFATPLSLKNYGKSPIPLQLGIRHKRVGTSFYPKLQNDLTLPRHPNHTIQHRRVFEENKFAFSLFRFL